jgi:hypothetical protein
VSLGVLARETLRPFRTARICADHTAPKNVFQGGYERPAGGVVVLANELSKGFTERFVHLGA